MPEAVRKRAEEALNRIRTEENRETRLQKSENRRRKKRFWRLIAVAAAVLLFGSITGAVVWQEWEERREVRMGLSEEEAAEQMDRTNETALDYNSVSNGITICAVHASVEKYTAIVTFTMEGLEVPEGKMPVLGAECTLDGRYREIPEEMRKEQENYQSLATLPELFLGYVRFDDGIVQEGETTEYGATSPMGFRGEGYAGEDGSLTFDLFLDSFEAGEFSSGALSIRFSDLYLSDAADFAGRYYNTLSQEEAENIPETISVEGEWSFEITELQNLSGVDSTVAFRADESEELYSIGLDLSEIEISPYSIRLVQEGTPPHKTITLGSGMDWDIPEWPSFSGFRMKDGHLEIGVPTVGKGREADRENGEAKESIIHFSHRIDPDQIDAILFTTGDTRLEQGSGLGQTEEDYVVVPVE